MLLIIRNLHVKIQNKKILNGLCLQINYGEIHAIMGPNGSGKSTLSAVLVGNPAYQVTKGEIIFDGHDLLALSPEQRSFLGLFLSFQYPVELPGVNMVDFIRSAVNEHQKNKSEKLLSSRDFLKILKKKRDIVQLEKSLLNRSVNEGFSGGEKKRNEIFQMAMLNPKLSVLDEIDSGLDIDALRIVSNGINLLKSSSNAIIMITHYHRLLNYIKPNKVHVLYDGKIVTTGPLELALELEKKGYDWLK